MDKIKKNIKSIINSSSDKFKVIQEIRNYLHKLSPNVKMPVDFVQWVPIELIKANDYNPNFVASKELHLLEHSIKQDGYTQPIVTMWNSNIKKYEIVDGFHRYFVIKNNIEIQKQTNNLLPIVVLKKRYK